MGMKDRQRNAPSHCPAPSLGKMLPLTEKSRTQGKRNDQDIDGTCRKRGGAREGAWKLVTTTKLSLKE